MKIDAHQHFWQYNSVRDTWIDDSMAILRRDFLPTDLETILKDNQIDGCVAVQADQSEEETKFLLSLAEKSSIIKAVVGWLDIRSETFPGKLETFTNNKKLRGLRHIVQAESKGFLLKDDFKRGIGFLSDFDLSYDILVFPHQLPEVIEFVDTFPDQRFVLDHLAKPYIKVQKIDSWKGHIETLANNPTIFCKLSGLVTEANWTSWDIKDFNPYLDIVFESFGADRLMYGSDWPVCLLAASYREQMNIIMDYIRKNSPDEMDSIMGDNALRFYKIE